MAEILNHRYARTGQWAIVYFISDHDLPEFIAYAKTNPGKNNMASGGAGSAQHVYGELFKAMAGVNMQHVPYRGGGPALTDLLAGQVPVMFDTLATRSSTSKQGNFSRWL